MPSVSQVATALQEVITTVAETAAHDTGCVQRCRQFTGASWIQTLVFSALAHPQPTLTDIAHMAAALGAPVSPQAIAQRFTPATAACLDQVLAAAIRHLVTANPVTIPVLARFNGVYVLDTSTIALPTSLAATWPGCGNGANHTAAALKLGVRLDLLHGTLTGPLLDPARTHDRRCAITAAPLPAGALRLADLGFWSLPDLAALSGDTINWLSRLQAQTTVLTPDAAAFDLDHLLATTAGESLDLSVRLGATAQVPARLLAVRVPTEVANARRRRMKADAKRRGHQPRKSRLDRANWLLLVTNVPADRLSLAEAVALARARWQIELLFKLWKSQGHIDEVRSANPDRVMSEILVKLVAMVIQHWTLLLGCWEHAARSLTKAAAVVREHAMLVALALRRSRRRLCEALTTLKQCLAVAGTITHRQKHPSLAQLLMADVEVPLT